MKRVSLVIFFEDEMPFDIDAPVIDILPEDYGIWFVDSMDHPDRYVGKNPFTLKHVP